jgi:hypothetical protein
VGKEYGINHEANSDSNFLAAGGCFFHSGTPWQLDFHPALLLKHLDNTKLIVCQNDNLFFSSSIFIFIFIIFPSVFVFVPPRPLKDLEFCSLKFL